MNIIFIIIFFIIIFFKTIFFIIINIIITFFLINFNKFEKTLRRKKLIYFLLSYYKIFKIFKFNNIIKKINDFNRDFFFFYNYNYNFNFKILFKI